MIQGLCLSNLEQEQKQSQDIPLTIRKRELPKSQSSKRMPEASQLYGLCVCFVGTLENRSSLLMSFPVQQEMRQRGLFMEMDC